MLDENENLQALFKSIEYSDSSIFNIILCDSKITADEIKNSLTNFLTPQRHFIDVFNSRILSKKALFKEFEKLIYTKEYKKTL
jgi:hypothetical protein